MNQQQLREHLQQLTTAIESMGASADDKDRLRTLIVDIEAQIDRPLLGEENVGLVEQVDGMISGFESDHPRVAGILNNIMVTLSSMGV